MPISTPPLSPRRDVDVNIMSPSPLRIGESKKNNNNNINDENNSNKENKENKENNNKNNNEEEEENASDANSPTRNEQNEKEVRGGGGGGGGGGFVGLGKKENVNVHKTHGTHGTHDSGGNTAADQQKLGSLSVGDVRVALLGMSMEDAGANAVAAEVETQVETQVEGGDGLSAAGPAAGPASGVTKEVAGHKYVSPSDALMSPCTQQLNALKSKKIARGGESTVRRLFGERIGKAKDTKEEKDGEED